MIKKLILISGPTASGKSKLAVKLAKKIKGEIINADSMQIYKELSILTSRPSKKNQREINHHLYGFLSAKKYFSVGQWLELVKKKIQQINNRKKIPIVVGGTGLYFNAITKGISKIPKINEKSRKRIRKYHKKIGQEKFYQELLNIDPKSKNKILSTDTQRTLRAYEVKFCTNKSIFEWAENTKSDFLNYDIKKILIEVHRINLLINISKRTKTMLNKKCIQQVKSFLKLKIEKSLSANKIIGLSEVASFIFKKQKLDQVEEDINIRTRQYAKRQMTWSRGHMANWIKIYSKDSTDIYKKVLKAIS